MDTTVIVIQSSEDKTLSISEKLHDVGKKLAKLMYNSPQQSLNGKSVVVMIPQKRIARDEKIPSKEVIALQNSIKHIVRYATNHGINIQIKEHSESESQ